MGGVIIGLAATLEREAPADGVVPPLWHWLYFLPVHRQSELGPDGHGRRGEFLPPVELPRRMWAGGRFEFHDGLRVGDRARRVSRIGSVQEKQGRLIVVFRELLLKRGLLLLLMLVYLALLMLALLRAQLLPSLMLQQQVL